MTSQAVVASSADWPMFWVQLIYTITTMLILIAAVWGERLRRWLSGPCFITTLNDPIGVLVYRNDGKPAWWFHLRVRNICAYTTATATVYCTKIERWDNTLHRWIDEAFPGSLPLCWAYSSVYGIQRVVGSDACIDLCYINANEDKLQFHFGFRPNNITPFLRKDERVKLHLSVEADGYLQSRVDCYELSWNGLWSDSKDDMFRNVTIQPIKDGMVVRNSDKDRKNKT